MTKQEVIENHRKMWNWIADETERQERKVEKEEYFREFHENIPLNKCYCCEFVVENEIGCKHCPINWRNWRNELNLCNTGDFASWAFAVHFGTWKEAAYLARKIANLPERK